MAKKRKRTPRSSATTSSGASPSTPSRPTACSRSAAARRKASCSCASRSRWTASPDRRFRIGSPSTAPRQAGRPPSRTAASACSCPRMETEIRLARQESAPTKPPSRVFADNLRELLLASPLGQKRLLAIDPGFRTGCKIVVLDRQGKLLHHDVIYRHRRLAEPDATKPPSRSPRW